MLIPRRLTLALGALVAILAVGTLGYRLLVGGTWFEGLYMTVITLSTTGFGEIVPGLSGSIPGRVFTMAMIIFGMDLLLWVVGSTTAFLVEGQLSTHLGRRKMDKRIAAMRQHVIVCGAGTTGIEVINEFVAAGVACVAIDSRQECIEKALQRVPFLHIEGDATSEEALVKAGILDASGIVTVLPEDKDNLVVTFMARQLNPDIRIVARGFDMRMRDRLLIAGASAVIFPDSMIRPTSGGSSAARRGRCRCVDRGCSRTRQARRCETPSLLWTHSTAHRRRDGLRSFPRPPPSGSPCPGSDPPRPSSDERFPPRAP